MNEKILAIAEKFCVSSVAALAALEKDSQIRHAREAPPAAFYEEVRMLAHRLAGTSRTLGFEEFSGELLDLERLARGLCEDPARDSKTIAAEIDRKIQVAHAVAAALHPENSRLWRGA